MNCLFNIYARLYICKIVYIQNHIFQLNKQYFNKQTIIIRKYL